MIKFKTIQFKNIGSFGNYLTTINFDEAPTTLAIGRNGSGKSFALLDAINIALYGSAFREINKPQIANSKNQAGWWIQLDFDVNEVPYRIIRSNGQPSLFQIYCNGVLRKQDAKLDQQKYLEEVILRVNQKSFSQIVVLGSSTYTSFMKLKSGDRRAVIEDLLDMKTFSNMNDKLKDRVLQFKSDWSLLTQKISTMQEKIELQKKHLVQLNVSKEKVISGNQKKIEQHSSDAVTFYEEKEKLEEELKTLMDSLPNKGELSRELSELQKMETELKTNIRRNKTDLDFFEKNQSCYTCTQPISPQTKTEQITKLKDSNAELTDTMMEIETSTKNLKDSIAEVESKMRLVSKLQSQIQEKDSQFIAAERFVSKLEKEIVELSSSSGDIEHCKDQLAKFESELSELEANKDSMTEDKYCLDVAGTLLKDSGIKAKLIKKYIPIINKSINSILRQMDFDVTFTINENFLEIVKSRGREEFSYNSFSEGEKLRIDIAILMTWREISKMRNSVSTNLLICDEILDSSADNEGGEDILKLFNELSKTTNVFIISHKGERMMDKFDRVIKFVKKQDFSYILDEQV